MQKYTKNTYIPEYFSDSTYSNLSGNSTPSGSTKVTPDSLETTIEVLLWLKNPFNFNLPIGATDILICPTNLVGSPLFRKKRFLVNLKTERNASKFGMFMEKENPRSFFPFSFRATFIFPL